MSDLRTAAQQALEAWQTATYGHPSHHKATLLAMTALNTAVAQQAEPVQVAERERVAAQWDGCVTHQLDTFGPVDIGASIRAGELVEAQQAEPHPDYPCRSDGRCQYAIDHGAEGLGSCPKGKCAIAQPQPAEDRAVAQDNLRVMREMFGEQTEPVAQQEEPVQETCTYKCEAWPECGCAPPKAEPVEPVACLIGTKGSAFDLPTTKRAYTYAKQPGNVVASRLGLACNAAASQSAGDIIDRGLGLLQDLQKQSFGVFDLGAEYAAPPQRVAQQAEPAEPVATVVARQYDDGTYAGNALDWAGRNCEDDFPVGTKLYTAPPQRRPLTEEEIESCRQKGYAHAGLGAPFDFGKAARAVEKASWEKNNG